jgi:hypothetical protein
MSRSGMKIGGCICRLTLPQDGQNCWNYGFAWILWPSHSARRMINRETKGSSSSHAIRLRGFFFHGLLRRTQWLRQSSLGWEQPKHKTIQHCTSFELQICAPKFPLLVPTSCLYLMTYISTQSPELTGSSRDVETKTTWLLLHVRWLCVHDSPCR